MCFFSRTAVDTGFTRRVILVQGLGTCSRHLSQAPRRLKSTRSVKEILSAHEVFQLLRPRVERWLVQWVDLSAPGSTAFANVLLFASPKGAVSNKNCTKAKRKA